MPIANAVVPTSVGTLYTSTVTGTQLGNAITAIMICNTGGASANLTFDKTTGDLFVGGNLNAYKELQVGVTTNRANTPTLDDWGRMRMFAANNSSTAYGFYFSYNYTFY